MKHENWLKYEKTMYQKYTNIIISKYKYQHMNYSTRKYIYWECHNKYTK